MNECISQRIAALREAMKQNGIAATIIPQTDPHQSEYIAEHWEVRRHFSGFTGSAGSLVVTQDEALLWTDSRYFIQAADQLNGTEIKLMKDGLPSTPDILSHLTATLPQGSTIGINGWLFPTSSVSAMATTLEVKGLRLRSDFDPIDTLWSDRPALPQCPVIIHDIKYAGEPASSKITKILNKAHELGANAMFVSALDEIAWILNIRSRDVQCNPVATAYLYISDKGSTLLIDSAKITAEAADHLKSNNVAIAPYSSVDQFLASLPIEERILIEPAKTSAAVANAIGTRAIHGTSPAAMLKACKNEIQIAGTRKAMIRDGVALVKGFMEIERKLNAGETLTEIEVGKMLTTFRAESPLYFDDSFDTIAGYRDHGAIVHYEATEETNATILPDGLLLIDSGAQYLDGTTDITRTISLGNTTELQRRDFTLVMKGHIALGSMIYPAGTTGHQLDALARQFLWKEGLTYLHGTGHGVGHFLNVHEGPQSIRLNYVPTPLTVGMITSNEPGLYREGTHGIRCENLVLTIPAISTEEFGDFLRFETLTLFPFDLNLFETSIMSDEEIKWVNDYHSMVREKLTPHLSPEQAEWLKTKTAELSR